MNHFDPQLDEKTREARESFINHREKQLQTITVAEKDSGVKFLFATNAGGAVSTLTYLGAIAASQNQQVALKSSLALFFFGIILIGIFHIFLAETYGSMFRKFQKSTASYYSNAKEWEEYISEIKQEAEQLGKSQVGRIIVYSSFICFILGSVLGTLSLFI